VNLQFYSRKIAERMSSKDTEPQEKHIMKDLEMWGKAVCERIGIRYPHA